MQVAHGKVLKKYLFLTYLKTKYNLHKDQVFLSFVD